MASIGDLTGTLRFDTREFRSGAASASAAVDQLDRSFLRLDGDVKQATADYRRGRIGLADYTTALRAARVEAQALTARGIAPAGAEIGALRSVMRATASTTGDSVRGVNTLRAAFGSLAFSAAGLPGVLGNVSALLTSFAVGSLATAGIFAGIAALGFAFRQFGEDARAAKKDVEEFIRGSAAFKASEAGRQRGAAETRAAEIRGVLGAGGRTSVIESGMAGPQMRFAPLRDSERQALIAELHGITDALAEVRAADAEVAREAAEFARTLARLNASIQPLAVPQVTRDQMLMGPGLAASAAARRTPQRFAPNDMGSPVMQQMRSALAGALGTPQQMGARADALRPRLGSDSGGLGGGIKNTLASLGGSFASLASPIGLVSLGLGALGIDTQALQKVIGKVVQVLLKMITAPLRLLAKIPFLGKPFKALLRGFDALTSQADKTNASVGGLGAAAREAGEALRNVPSGVKVSLERFRAISTATAGGTLGGTLDGRPQHESSDPWDRQANRDVWRSRTGALFGPGSIIVSGVRDPAEAARQVIAQARATFLRGGVTDLDIIGAEGVT